MTAAQFFNRWKAWRRARRVRRELEKAMFDASVYGSGAMYTPSDGSEPRHIPLKDLKLP